MIEVLESKKQQNLLYSCKAEDTLDTIANKFGITTAEILRANPLFSSVYEGCMLYLKDIGKTRVTVAPLQTLEDVAKDNNVSVEAIMKTNNLRSRKVFVGMQLLIDKKGD